MNVNSKENFFYVKQLQEVERAWLLGQKKYSFIIAM